MTSLIDPFSHPLQELVNPKVLKSPDRETVTTALALLAAFAKVRLG